MNATRLLLLCALFGTPGIVIAQSNNTTDQLIACARIGDDAARATCYEELGREALSEADATRAAPVATEAAAATSATESGTAGATVPATSAATNVPIKGEGRPAEEYQVVVASCDQNKNKEMYFFLDNGEVWKQTGGSRVLVNDCNGAATIRKDLFGYKISIGDSAGATRVKRIK